MLSHYIKTSRKSFAVKFSLYDRENTNFFRMNYLMIIGILASTTKIFLRLLAAVLLIGAPRLEFFENLTNFTIAV